MTKATPVSAAGIHRRMKALANPSRAAGHQRFFKTGAGEYGEGDRFLGITVPVVRQLARSYDTLPLPEISRLLESPWHEERQLALFVLVRQYSRADAIQRAAIYKLYLARKARINSWDLVDGSAEHILGAHLAERDRARLHRLARSAGVWDRRMAILATFHYIKRGDYAETLTIARLLLEDSHDLIHKAVGWMLREIGNRDRGVAERFLKAHAVRMPRTMLRYAIERFPAPLRRHYLAMRPARRS